MALPKVEACVSDVALNRFESIYWSESVGKSSQLSFERRCQADCLG